MYLWFLQEAEILPKRLSFSPDDELINPLRSKSGNKLFYVFFKHHDILDFLEYSICDNKKLPYCLIFLNAELVLTLGNLKKSQPLKDAKLKKLRITLEVTQKFVSMDQITSFFSFIEFEQYSSAPIGK